MLIPRGRRGGGPLSPTPHLDPDGVGAVDVRPLAAVAGLLARAFPLLPRAVVARVPGYPEVFQRFQRRRRHARRAADAAGAGAAAAAVVPSFRGGRPTSCSSSGEAFLVVSGQVAVPGTLLMRREEGRGGVVFFHMYPPTITVDCSSVVSKKKRAHHRRLLPSCKMLCRQRKAAYT